jgi:hypothetical protein
MITDVNWQSIKDISHITTTVLGMLMIPVLPSGHRNKVSCNLLYSIPSIELYTRLLTSTSIDNKLPHSAKAVFSIAVVEDGMVTEVKELQALKAECLIVTTEDGIVTDITLLQEKKALFPILATLSFITIVLIDKRLEYHGVLAV